MKNRTYKTLLFCFGIFLALFADTSCKNNSLTPPDSEITTHGIIPLPKQLEFTGEKLNVSKNFILVKNNSFNIAFGAVEELFSNSLESYKVSDSFSPGDESLQLITDNSIGNNAYELLINSTGIQIKAGNEEGAFFAVQSLKQFFWHLTNGQKQTSIELPGIRIIDEPKYEWRGFHVDLSRHMFTKEYIFKIIDWLSYYKFNKLHLHLTDDQGWRLESKKFPLLNEIGSWRTFDKYDSICIQKAKSDPDFNIDPRFIQTKNGKTMYGGFYSNNEITEIVNYAKIHFIEIIPEIDMPGHMSAAIKGYPFLSCTGSSGWGTEFSYPICPCTDEVYEFVFGVYDEISELFPSAYIHIGADEVEKDTWEQSRDCKDFMKKNNLTNVKEIQSYFVEKFQKHLESKGKTVITWDDVTDGKMDSNLKIMYWRDWVKDAPDKAAANENEIIFTRWDLFYLSGEYSDENFRKLFEFDIQKEYSKEVASKIIGFQGCVWTEEIPSEAVFESYIFPRLQALSEVNWSGTKDWNSFSQRLAVHIDFLNSKAVNLK
jgi:hexosaminidase